VSRSLLLEYDPIDQPAAADPVERQTWCTLSIRVGHRFVSRIWDKTLQNERIHLYVPAFPIAEWIALNWWSLLNELCPWETVPRSGFNSARMGWTKRHCLRSADSALLLPKLFVFHDGQSLRTEWHADIPDSLPNMPGEFTADGAERLDSATTEESFAQFINSVLAAVAGVNDIRVGELSDHWRAIQAADSEERRFCTLAGRMGIDPYNPNEMTEELALFLEGSTAQMEEPLLRDLTEVGQPESIEQQWSWVRKTSLDLKLGPSSIELPFALPPRYLSPPEYGYQLARRVRATANIESGPLGTVEEVARPLIKGQFRLEARNHIPGQGILAIVGQSSSGDVVSAGPMSQNPLNQRFLAARSLYHALVTNEVSQRLVTRAYSWDQKASRAFAAELLAPQRSLLRRLATTIADPQTIDVLSKEFNASTMVIEKQLENAGVPLSCE
jgi:hypothetical protein